MQKVMNFIGIFAWAVCVAVILFYFPQLPNELPSSYNLKGEVNSWANKWFIFIFPIVSIALWFWVARKESKTKPVFEEGTTASRQFSNMTELLYVIRFEVMLFISWLTIRFVLQALEGENNSWIWDFLVFIIILIATSCYYALKHKKLAQLKTVN